VGGVITNPGLQQAWNLDATGNWKDFAQFDPANNATNTFDQQRTSNAANEIIDMVPTVGGTWATPGYDRNGNMTTIPQPQPTNSMYAYTATPDAWNRLMKLADSTTGLTVQQNQYDGRNFRTIRQTYSGGSLSESRDFYYSSAWQALYETVSGSFDREYAWGLRYIDDLVLRIDTARQLYAMQDANWNVVGICDDYGNVLERYAYTAYGVCTVLNPDFSVKTGGTAYDWTVLYTGRALDIPTGLYYYRMRLYHAALGVLIAMDPLESGASPYEYCTGMPCCMFDPFGLQSVENRQGNKFTPKDLDEIYKRFIEAYKSKVNPRTPCITVPLDEFYRLLPARVRITDQMRWSLVWGCIGFAGWLQNQDAPTVVDKNWSQHKSWEPPALPEDYGNTENSNWHTQCFLKVMDAKAIVDKLKARGIDPFVFGRQGRLKVLKPKTDSYEEKGRVANDTVVPLPFGNENYISVFGNYYVWMNNWRIVPSRNPNLKTPDCHEPNPKNPETSIDKLKQHITICARDRYDFSAFSRNMPATMWCVTWCDKAK
jgi:RHS repeat-associated protein